MKENNKTKTYIKEILRVTLQLLSIFYFLRAAYYLARCIIEFYEMKKTGK